MSPTEVLLAKLPGVKRAGNGWSARCPAHDDRRASLSISEGDDGRALVKCHAGCTAEAVVAALGLTVRDLMPEPDDRPPHRNGKPKSSARTFSTADAAVQSLTAKLGRRSRLWAYQDAVGNPVGVVVRWNLPDGSKDIRPVSQHADGWRVGAMPDPRPLYRLPELAKATRVVVAEGEKAADAARSIGFTATTSAGGSQAAGKTDWYPLAGKEVWILADNDAPGRKYAATVAGILAVLRPAPVVRIVELPGLPEKGDIADWIDAHGDAAESDGMREEVEALVRMVEPEPAGTPDAVAERPRDFPVDTLPQPLREFVSAGAKAIGCDPSYIALPLLVALAAAIGNTRRLELKRGWSAPAILWGAVVGESGTAKTPAFALVMRPARERQRKALERHAVAVKEYEAALARWDKELTAWKRDKGGGDPPEKPEPPRAERYVVSDTTVEALAPILLANPRGVLLARDELAGWIGSFDRYSWGKGGSDGPSWLSMYNGEDMTVDRKTGTRPTIHVPRATVSVVGGIQPAVMRRALGDEHRESGLAARLLLAFPPRVTKEWTEADIDPRAEAEIGRLFDRLYDLQPAEDARPVLVRMDPTAKAAWVTYYNAHAKEQVGLTGDLSAAWSKLEECAARLALVIHLARWAFGDPDLTTPDSVDATSMGTGIALSGWFKVEARRVYAMFGETPAEGEQRKLVEWIDRKGRSVTAREVQQGCRWLKDPGAAEEALEELVKAGRGSWRPPETTSKGGRPKRVFVLSTPSTIYETPPTDMARGGSVDVDSVDEAEAQPASEPELFPFGFNNPDGGRLFPESRGTPD